jgi:hypothetical protein
MGSFDAIYSKSPQFCAKTLNNLSPVICIEYSFFISFWAAGPALRFNLLANIFDGYKLCIAGFLASIWAARSASQLGSNHYCYYFFCTALSDLLQLNYLQPKTRFQFK